MKKLILTTAFAVYAVFGFSQTPYWSYGFENGALTDAMGNDNLVQNGSAMSIVSDRFGSANDAVNLAGDHLVGGSTGAGSYSVSLWIKDAVNDATDRAVADQFHDNYGFRIRLHNGVVKVTHRFGYSVNNNPYQGSSTGYLVGTTDVADGAWHHVVLTAREYITNGFEYNFQYKLFIDGVQEASDIRTVSMISGANRQHEGLASGSTFTVGSNLSDNVNHYENTVDDIAFYKTDLSSSQVTAIYTARPAMTIYVDEDATGANNGSSWTDAFTSLKDATDFATISGDEIWIAEGVYTPDASSRTASFRIMPGVSLYGGFNGTETALSQRDWRSHESILSGDLSGNDNANVSWSESTRSENSYRVVVLDDAGSNTLIDGVTISGGHANHGSDNNYNRGAAIRMENAANSVDVRNCIIENNVANLAAGIMAEFSSSNAHTANLENCTFRNNVSRFGSSYMISILSGTGDATISNCLMLANQAIDLPPGTGYSGPGGFLDSRAGTTLNAEVVNCTFLDNVNTGTNSANSETSTLAARRHGGTFNLTVANCVFDGNTASKSIGRMNTLNCPTTALLVNNIRPDVASTVCLTSSINETSLAPNLDANGRPVAGSNTIDAGDNTYAVGTEDIDGNNRTLGGTIDMGAFEFDPSACNPITQQPANTSGCEGDDITFSVGTTGTITSYQWKFNGVNISGATSSSVTISNVNSFNVGNYEVEVVAACGTVTSSVATFTMNTAAPTIDNQPIDAAGCESDDVLVYVDASGSGLTYQWQKDGVDVAGETSASIFFDGIDASDAGNYTVIVGGTNLCPITSDVAVVTVNEAPTITQQPTDQLSCLGDDATFTAAATGATLTQWYKNGNPLAGELSPTLTLSSLVAGDLGTYKMIASNSCGALFTADADLNIGSTTTITSHPQSVAQCENTTATFSVGATGTNISYQWQLDGQDINGQTSPNLLVNGIDQADEGDYTCVVTGACGVETSDVAPLSVLETTAINIQSTNESICEGADFTFSVVAAGSNLTYQWKLGGVDLNGETSGFISYTNVGPTLAGSYTVDVSGDCGMVSSSAMVLTVTETPEPVIVENMGMLETGVFDTYQWYIDGIIQNGETSASITVTVSGDYTVEVTDNGCQGTSAPYNVMTVGIEERAVSIVAAYPNPFIDNVTIALEGFVGNAEVTVVDMAGRVVFSSMEMASKVQLNLEHLSSGTYGLIVRGEDGKTATSRLIKN